MKTLAGTPSAAVIHDRLEWVRERIREAGRDPGEVTIIAVTKGHPVEACRAAVSAGLNVLGENRVQEALRKLGAVPEAEWHLVGHLQTNKVRQVAGRFALIQSVDSKKLVDALAERDAQQPVLVEVNVAREAQKHGVDPEHALELVAHASERLPVRGLMAMGPLERDPLPAFRELAKLRGEAQERLGCTLPILSMGMSDDFEAALKAGSNMLRLGRVLFGPRAA